MTAFPQQPPCAKAHASSATAEKMAISSILTVGLARQKMSIMNRFIIWMYSKKRISFDIRFRCVPIGRTFFLHHFAYFLFQPPHNLFFQSGNIGLRNSDRICYLFLRFFSTTNKTKSHFHYIFFSRI